MRGEGGIRRVEQVMALVEDEARRSAALVHHPARHLCHHQRVVGDDDLRPPGLADVLFDVAAAEVVAGGIDAFAAMVAECDGAGGAEQVDQPCGKVAARQAAVA